jgi:quercetin dioxygenase-like cupin family protein
MEFCDLNAIEVEPRRPRVIGTRSEGRAIVVNLPAGESMDEHQVRERAVVVVCQGRIEVTDAGGHRTPGTSGCMFMFEPDERHSVLAKSDARFLLMLAPWSLDEHSSMDPWQKGDQ